MFAHGRMLYCFSTLVLISALCLMGFSPAPQERPAAHQIRVRSGGVAVDVNVTDSNDSTFPCSPGAIPRYTAYRVAGPIKLDGQLKEKSWRAAPRSARFVDILTGQPTWYDTRAAVLWDDTNLYVAFWVEEPNVAAKLREYGSHIYEDNDVELFVAGRDTYYELELNALNTIYEVFFIWEDAYDRGGYAGEPAFNRSNPKVRPFNGVAFRNHPRGRRVGSWDWRFPGLRTAVHVDGTLNNGRDKDRGWTVELSLPWAGMTWLARADGRALPPKDGDVWRVDFSRFNQYKAPAPARDSGGWFWSPHGVWDSHIPECFPFIRFSHDDVTKAKVGQAFADRAPDGVIQ